MNTVANSHSENLVSRFLGWLSRGWEAAGETQALASLDRETIAMIARDCGMEPSQLLDVAKAGPHAADEMIAMMKALDIDPMEVATRYQDQFRDMQLNCSQCTSKAHCRKDIAAGSAARHFNDYCNNADHLIAMRATPAL
jgi:hypothetical protein